jgi:hypothetical protein
MNKPMFPLIFASAMLSSACLADDACPRTVGSAEPAGWFGTDSFAAQLPAGGVWPTTEPGHLIAVKLIWRSAGFKPGMETNLAVTVKPLNGAQATAVVLGNTNAYAGDFGGWAMMTGIDLPSAGCWEITGRYRGEELRFVVETVQRTPL